MVEVPDVLKSLARLEGLEQRNKDLALISIDRPNHRSRQTLEQIEHLYHLQGREKPDELRPIGYNQV